MTRRIGIVCGAGIVSGKEIMALELAEGLRERNYALEIVTALWGNGEFARRSMALGFPVHRLWLGFISATLRLDCFRMTAHQALRWPQLVASYRRFLRQTNTQLIIHTNWQHLLLLWPFLKPERDLFWLHELVPNKPQYRRVFRFLASRLQCFVPVSHAAARSLADIGIAPDKIQVIHNGLRDPVPAGWVKKKQWHGIRIGVVGQVGAWKGHEDLLDAFALLVKSHPDVELHVFGRGTEAYESQLKHRIASLGITDKVVWHGFVSDRATIFQSIDICSVPSRCEESFGLVAAEAGFFGLPVVASRRGGLPEIVQDGVTGLLFEAGKVDELATRLKRLVADEQICIAMGIQARTQVAARFGRDRFINDFVELLEGRSSRAYHGGRDCAETARRI